MKCLPVLCTVMILCTFVTTANDVKLPQVQKSKHPQLLSKLSAASSCNVLYRDVVGKICLDWRGRHGLAALYDLLPVRTAVQRDFKRTASASYEKTFGRIPEKMPLALPRFERMKNRYRALLKQYNELKQTAGQKLECPECPGQPVTPPVVPPCPPDQTVQLQRELSERTQQLNDSIAVATKSIAELSTQLAQKQTPDKNIAEGISALSQQIGSLTGLLSQQKAGITEDTQKAEDARKEIEAAKQKFEAEKTELEEAYKKKTKELTDQLVATSKQLSEVTFLLQGKKGEPIISEDELSRVTEQLNLVNAELIEQKNQTVKEQQFAKKYQHTLDDLKSALSNHILKDQRLMDAYNNYSEMFATQSSYSTSSIRPVVDTLKSKWNDYVQSIDSINFILRAVGMADIQIKPNECYSLKVKGALMGHDVEIEEPIPVISESELLVVSE